jgi:hypothetical protein
MIAVAGTEFADLAARLIREADRLIPELGRLPTSIRTEAYVRAFIEDVEWLCTKVGNIDIEWETVIRMHPRLCRCS